MAEFLTTQGTAHYLEDIIINANKWLILVCPYLNITDNFLQRLQDADKKNVEIYIIFGKKDLKREEEIKLRKLRNLKLRYYQNLHAKCYANEDTMIITSMNLLEFSEKKNREMGILIRKENVNDKKIYDDAMREVKSIMDLSTEENVLLDVEPRNVKKYERNEATPPSTKKDNSTKGGEGFFGYLKEILTQDVSILFSASGHCIHCGKSISYDPEKPYCIDCYNTWKKWKNPSHIEKYCHSCGKSDSSSMLYPLCRACFQKQK